MTEFEFSILPFESTYFEVGRLNFIEQTENWEDNLATGRFTYFEKFHNPKNGATSNQFYRANFSA